MARRPSASDAMASLRVSLSLRVGCQSVDTVSERPDPQAPALSIKRRRCNQPREVHGFADARRQRWDATDALGRRASTKHGQRLWSSDDWAIYLAARSCRCDREANRPHRDAAQDGAAKGEQPGQPKSGAFAPARSWRDNHFAQSDCDQFHPFPSAQGDLPTSQTNAGRAPNSQDVTSLTHKLSSARVKLVSLQRTPMNVKW